MFLEKERKNQSIKPAHPQELKHLHNKHSIQYLNEEGKDSIFLFFEKIRNQNPHTHMH